MNITYCNPLPIPDVGDGRKTDCMLTRRPEREYCDYRSISDPSVVYWEGKWILYPSYRIAYITEDFVHWKHVDIGVPDVSYSPAIVQFKGNWYLFGHSSPDFYQAPSPLGPFVKIAEIEDANGVTCCCPDGCMLADGEHLYLFYHGSCEAPKGISLEYCTCTYGVEMNPEKPWKMLNKPTVINRFDPSQAWLCLGEHNQNKRIGWIEGQWAIKINSRYYLLYSGCGTEFSTYANGVLYSDEGPLKGYQMQKNHNPFTLKNTGLMRGAGHGCLVNGPLDTLWVFYTNTFCYNHIYERRISMDAVGIDENGELFCPALTEVPQLAPGTNKHPEQGNGAGLLPLTFMLRPTASSCAPGRDALYAVDDSTLTFWQPADDDKLPTLTIVLSCGHLTLYAVSALRILWRDIGMEVLDGIYPGAIRYTVEYRDADGWHILVDASDNQEDLCVDYRQFEPVNAYEIRLRILGAPKGITPAVANITAFGVCITP